MKKKKKIKKASEIFEEYLKRGYDDVMDFRNYLNVRKKDKTIKIILGK